MQETTLSSWETRFADWLTEKMADADMAHDLSHIRRVVANAKMLAAEVGADLAVVVPAAWLHDCVTVPKNSPLRAQASRLAAEAAADFLQSNGYPREHIAEICHAVAAHSFSAQIAPETLAAKVVQDADRLDSLGAIGVIRCAATNAGFGVPIYHPDEPFPQQRTPNDKEFMLDHFYVKLLKLADTMQTAVGKAEARRRTAFMRTFLDQLAGEIA